MLAISILNNREFSEHTFLNSYIMLWTTKTKSCYTPVYKRDIGILCEGENFEENTSRFCSFTDVF